MRFLFKNLLLNRFFNIYYRQYGRALYFVRALYALCAHYKLVLNFMKRQQKLYLFN